MFVPPNERRNFVHKRIAGAVVGLATGGVIGGVVGFARGGGAAAARTDCVRNRFGVMVLRGTSMPCAARAPGRSFGPADPCGFGRVFDPVSRQCVAGFGTQVGRDVPVGEATMGRFGAALTPMADVAQILRCLPGMVLGTDDLCYNRRDIRNADRKWPRGTRPLGTPGEMAALRKAASFGRRMETTVKRMQKIGVLKKPAPRKAAAPKPKMLTSGEGVRVVNVE